MQTPSQNTVTQGKHGQYNAVDIGSSPDPYFYAPEDGIISALVPNNGDCGHSLKLKGATGEHGFCHIEIYNVQLGDQVKRGQKLAKMGYTGKTIPPGPNGRHLHWILNRGGAWVYPPGFINELFIRSEGDEIDMEEIQKLYKLLDETNKRLDSLFKIVDQGNKDREKLYGIVDNINKRLDKLKTL